MTSTSVSSIRCVAIPLLFLPVTSVGTTDARRGLSAGAKNGPVYFANQGDLFAVAANGTNRRRIAPSAAEETDPSASPDGTELAFRTGNDEIFRIGVDGKNRVNLTRNGAHDISPAWGPSGRRFRLEPRRHERHLDHGQTRPPLVQGLVR